MPYITKKSPTPRSGDTPLGKIMGYVAEMLEYLRWENACGIADAFFPDYFPLNIVQDTIINIFRRIYDDIYQEAYNNSANKGNEMNGQIMGWLDDVKNQAFAKVNEAQTYIQNNLINPIKTKIDTEITPKINDALSRLSTVRTDVDKAISDLTTMGNRVNSFGSSITNFESKLKSFDTTMSSLQTKASDLDSAIKEAQSKLATYKGLIDDLDKRLRTVEGQKAFTLPNLPDIFKTS